MPAILKAFVASAFMAFMLLRQQLHLDEGPEPPGAGAGFNSTVIPGPPEICTNRDCVVAAALYHTNLMDDIEPCQDFSAFTCGNYRFYNEVPPGRAEQSTLNNLRGRVGKQLVEVLSAQEAGVDKPYERLAKKYFQKCIDTKTINDDKDHKKIFEVANKIFNGITLPHIFGGNEGIRWYDSIDALIKHTLHLPIMDIGVIPSGNDSSKNILTISQSSRSLIEHEAAYHEKPDNDLIEKLIKMLSEDVLVSLGVQLPDAQKAVREVIELEKELVKHKVKNLRDPANLYRYMKKREFRNNLPSIQLHFFNNLKRRYKFNAKELEFNVASFKYFEGVQDLLRNTPVRIVNNYAFLIWLKSMSGFMADTIRQPFNEYSRLARGIRGPLGREEECIDMVTRDLPMATSSLYIKAAFELDKVKEPVTELFQNITRYLAREISQSKWLDGATKTMAIGKVENIGREIGYPSFYKDDALLAEKHACFTSSSNEETFIALGHRIAKCNKDAYFDTLLGPRTDDLGFIGDAKAAYQPSSNSIAFYSGILQYPFLLPDAPKYVVFGAFGTIIGRELQRAFDVINSQYDKKGNVDNWWVEKSKKKFAEKAQCFKKQYTEEGIDGDLTVGENMADSAGLKTAYNAYKRWLVDHPDHREDILPGFEHYTPDQMFFVSWANNWCNIYDKKAIERSTNVPTHLRLKVPAQNSVELNNAFSCKKGSATNPEKKCDLW